jgi:signal transduction histidine kinase
MIDTISVKSKTIILVLTIISILSIVFFYIRYTDIKEFAHTSQTAELKKVQFVYKKILSSIKKFYITRGYANINSYGIKKSFITHNDKALHQLSQPRWDIISKENIFLESFCFYDQDGKLLTYFGKKPSQHLSYSQKSKISYDGFWFDINSFNYHAVAIARDTNNNKIGFIMFVINPKYFLLEIRKLIDIDAYILYKKPNKEQIIFNLNKEEQQIKLKSNHYQPYIIRSKGITKQNNFEIIFLQNTSYWTNIIKKAFFQGIFILLIIAIVTFIVVNYGFDIILKELDMTNKKLLMSQNKLKELNQNLQIRVNQEIELKLAKQEEAEEKKRMLVHQNKLASMGEMIGNIAHQWRQPLTELSLIFISIELYFERDKLTKEILTKKIKEANEQIAYMSNTIDDFRNFFVSGKEKNRYFIKEIIDLVSHLLSASLTNNKIDLQIIIDNNFELYGYPNEIAQAILNIISNAKDIILENNIQNGQIVVKAFSNNKGVFYLNISDNAGGVKVSPIQKIFEPYFSTKHAKSGTGIGLYMTKVIIEKNNNGTINVSNYKNGAIFNITFVSDKSLTKIS